MMTSANSSFPRRLTKIDELTRGDHTFLTKDDACFFLGEYTARKAFSHSATNNLIQNLKKPMDRRGTSQWRWKENAIAEAAQALRDALAGGDLRAITFVPMPPSKAKSDPLYDDRMSRILANLGQGLDIRELLVVDQSMAAAHESADRPRPEALVLRLRVDTALCEPPPPRIVLCDDVLTTGSHFRAAQTVLMQRFPSVNIFGVFLARRVPQPPEFEVVQLDDN